MVSEKTAHNYLNAGLFDADITQHFRCQTENFQGCDLPLQKSKRQSDLWEFFAIFPISCLMLLILTHSMPLKREFSHICKSESKFLNFAVAFTLTNLHLLLQVSKFLNMLLAFTFYNIQPFLFPCIRVDQQGWLPQRKGIGHS